MSDGFRRILYATQYFAEILLINGFIVYDGSQGMFVPARDPKEIVSSGFFVEETDMALKRLVDLLYSLPGTFAEHEESIMQQYYPGS